jgi:hypothetical protein
MSLDDSDNEMIKISKRKSYQEIQHLHKALYHHKLGKVNCRNVQQIINVSDKE